MRTYRTMLAVAGTAGLLLGGGLALAEDAAPPPQHPGREWCKENPGKCDEARAKHEAWCAQNPDRCAKAKERRAARREWCEKNPEECAQKKAEWQQKHAELKAKCDADPAKCNEMKQQMRQQMREKHGMGGGMGGSNQPGTGGGSNPPAQ